jgi:hypothetical protein
VQAGVDGLRSCRPAGEAAEEGSKARHAKGGREGAGETESASASRFVSYGVGRGWCRACVGGCQRGQLG